SPLFFRTLLGARPERHARLRLTNAMNGEFRCRHNQAVLEKRGVRPQQDDGSTRAKSRRYKLPPIQRPDTCAVACLRMILAHRGTVPSEAELIEVAAMEEAGL